MKTCAFLLMAGACLFVSVHSSGIKFVGLIIKRNWLGCPLAVMAALGMCATLFGQAPANPATSAGAPDHALMAYFAEADAALTEDVGQELAVHQAVLAYQQDRYADALQQLQASGSQRLAAKYFQCLALIQLDRVDEASQVLDELKASPGVPDLIDVGIAQALIDKGHPSEGKDLLQKYSAAHPEDNAATNLLYTMEHPEAALASPPPLATGSTVDCDDCVNIAPPAEVRNWNLTFLTGYDYDTNVVRAPTFQGLGGGQQLDDSSWITALFGDYRFIQEQDLVVGAIGSVFYADRFTLNQFDTFNLVGGAYATRAIEDVLFGANYQYVETLLGGSHFSGEHRLVGNATLLEGDFGHTTAFYEFNANDINAPALIPAQEQSGTTNAVGLTQAIYLFEGAGRFFGGYRFSKNAADGSDFDYNSNMITARVEVPLDGEGWMSNWIGDAEFRVFFDRYDNPNSLDFFGNPRSDDRVEFRTGLQKFMTEHLSLRVDYTFVNNSSNVANLFGVRFYDYDRHAITSQIIYDF